MSATNHTEYYDLSQFKPDDVPSWEGDYNSDMKKIDEAIHEAQAQTGTPLSVDEFNTLWDAA